MEEHLPVRGLVRCLLKECEKYFFASFVTH
jgi:hypothetical protein